MRANGEVMQVQTNTQTIFKYPEKGGTCGHKSPLTLKGGNLCNNPFFCKWGAKIPNSISISDVPKTCHGICTEDTIKALNGATIVTGVDNRAEVFKLVLRDEDKAPEHVEKPSTNVFELLPLLNVKPAAAVISDKDGNGCC